MIEKLKDFFTSKHLKILHENHHDILFNGHLYFYNDGINILVINSIVNGKIELHSLEELNANNCDPLEDNHLILTRK